jgi:hypothetical protein
VRVFGGEKGERETGPLQIITLDETAFSHTTRSTVRPTLLISTRLLHTSYLAGVPDWLPFDGQRRCVVSNTGPLSRAVKLPTYSQGAEKDSNLSTEYLTVKGS